jgi:predicted nucleic acid-binding protein
VKPAVLNASPLIVLAKAGYLDLVPRIVSPVVIPRAVANEISTGGPDDPAAQFLARRSWLSVADLVPALSPLATWHLGQGESEVLEYARRNSGTLAVLDDKAARRVARALDIPLTGTLGIIVAAVQMKLLPALSAAIDAVRACGLYVDSATVARLLMDDIKERS